MSKTGRSRSMGIGHLNWTLDRATDSLIPALVKSGGTSVLKMIGRALDKEIRADLGALSQKTRRGNPWLYDGSTFWMENLSSKQTQQHDIKAVLAYQLITASRLLMDEVAVSRVVSALNPFKPLVFRRIQLQLLTEKLDADLAFDWLKDERVIRQSELNQEYSALLKAAVPRLTRDQVSKVCEALANVSESVLKWRTGKEEERVEWAGQWLRDRLGLIADSLDENWRRKYEKLVASYGSKESIDPGHGPIVTWMGPNSPKSDEELASLSVEQLVSFMRDFSPQRGWGPSPSPEGLGRALSSVVTANPDKYVGEATRFIGLQPTYVRSLFDGLRNVRRAKKSFAWEPLLDLGEWVASIPTPDRDVVDQAEFEGHDPDWRWARKALADLIATGFQGDGQFPLAYRTRVWSIIEALAADSNPTVEYEAKYGGTNMDPYTLAINTVRPQAIDAAIQFAFWVGREGETSRKEQERPVSGLAKAPEAAALIERHLDPASDQSRAVRAVIGHWLASLVWFDAPWVKRNWDSLFPVSPDLLFLTEALWGSHLVYGRLFTTTFELESMYRAALAFPPSDAEARRKSRDPDLRLAEHIITFYCWGLVPLSQPGNLVAAFFDAASGEQKKRAIEYVGRSISGPEKTLPADLIARLVALWDWRYPALMEQAAKGNADARAEAVAELEEFGWWVASKRFDPAWAVPRLAEVVAITGGVERGGEVLEFLETLIDELPEAAIDILAHFKLERGADPWRTYFWRDPAKRVMAGALASGNPRAVRKATDLVNRWVAGGNIDFKDLLGPAATSGAEGKTPS